MRSSAPAIFLPRRATPRLPLRLRLTKSRSSSDTIGIYGTGLLDAITDDDLRAQYALVEADGMRPTYPDQNIQLYTDMVQHKLHLVNDISND